MVLTVKQLIRKLKKMPPDAKVAYQAHDMDEDSEIDAWIGNVALATHALCANRGEKEIVLLLW